MGLLALVGVRQAKNALKGRASCRGSSGKNALKRQSLLLGLVRQRRLEKV